jgi:hypothetical protein
VIHNPEKSMRDLVLSLTQIAVSSHQAEIEQTYCDAVDYAEHREWGIGLELLCINLYEYEFPLPNPIYEKIVQLANKWGIDQHYVEVLRELIPDSAEPTN